METIGRGERTEGEGKGRAREGERVKGMAEEGGEGEEREMEREGQRRNGGKKWYRGRLCVGKDDDMWGSRCG